MESTAGREKRFQAVKRKRCEKVKRKKSLDLINYAWEYEIGTEDGNVESEDVDFEDFPV